MIGHSAARCVEAAGNEIEAPMANSNNIRINGWLRLKALDERHHYAMSRSPPR